MRRISPLLILLLGCGDGDEGGEGTPGPTIRFAMPAQGVPIPLSIPFPSDLYREKSGTIEFGIGSWDLFSIADDDLVVTLAFIGLDGFGRTVGAIFRVDAEEGIDSASLLEPRAILIVDVDPDSPEPGAVVPSAAGYDELLRTITVQPERTVLAPGRTYAVVVTTGVRTASGTALGPAPDLGLILRGEARGARIAAIIEPVLEPLAAAGVEPTDIAGLAVFTTTTRHTLVRRAREALVAGAYGPPPQLEMDPTTIAPYGAARFGADPHPGWTATLEEWLGTPPLDGGGGHAPGFPGLGLEAGVGTAHDGIGAVLSGALISPELRRPFVGTSAVDDGTIELDATGTFPVAVDRTARVPVTIVLPRQPPPASGWPVVLFGHGTPTHRSYVMSVANELAKAGLATVAIDAPEHGMRTPGVIDGGSAFTGSYRGPDGLADDLLILRSGLEALGNLKSFARARDVRVQTIVDYCQVVRLVQNPDLDLSAASEQYGGATLRLDPERIGWVGVSYGGIQGMILSAVEPEVDAFVLDVGGGLEYVTIGGAPANLTTVDFALLAFGAPSSGEMRLSRFNPVLTLLQMLLDSGDAAAFAGEQPEPDQGAASDVYLIQVDHDENVPNYGTEVVAAMMGIPQIADSPVDVPGLASVAAPVGPRGGPIRALLIQPLAVHGRNLTSRTGQRTAETPFPREDAPLDQRIVYLDEPVTVRQSVAAAQRSMVGFLVSSFAGPATIDITGLEMWFDFDDDGWTDEEEQSAGTDPFDPAEHPPGEPTHPRSL